MEALLNNTVLWTTLLAALIAQLIKGLQEAMFQKQFKPRRLFETGGMPSSHSAAVASLASSMGLNYGWDSPYFTISTVLAIIVIYDATGIRRAAGEHAIILNELIEEFNHVLHDGLKSQNLKTLLGHTYPQAAVGIIIGVVMAVLIHNWT
jgi:uncharacterized protein